MRVAYVLKKFPRLSETFILNELLGLEESGIEVEVVSLREPDDEPRHKDLARLRAPVHFLRRPRSPERIPDQGDDARDLIAGLERIPGGKGTRRWAQGAALARLAKQRGYDHIHAHFMTVAAQVAAASRVQGGPTFTVTCHAKDIFRHGIDADLFRAVSARTSGIVTVSDFNRRFVADRFFSGRADRIHRIYNGLPLDDPSFLTHATSASTRSSQRILAVGRLVEKKGFDLLLKALAQLRDEGLVIGCDILGDGDESGALRELARSLNLDDVHFAGPQPRDEVLRAMGRAEMMVLPCRRGRDGNQDALPTVLIEAMAMGLPIVSTRLVGIPEIVEDTAQGLLVDPDDVAGLANSIRRLHEDAALRRRAQESGPRRARRLFDRKKTLPQLVSVFRGAIRNAAAREESRA
ncbi:MAG TPA: colanic acid biosynthesis glycosyltransferase WcaL [Planctomycetes bacterium]|nr:colanic acid biosynthesis glycosyltransferase WcaL [Planctomycetota bacterium]